MLHDSHCSELQEVPHQRERRSAALRDSSGSPDLDRVVDRAFHVLDVLRKLGPGAHPLNDIVRSTDLSRSTVQRIIGSGVRMGMIQREKRGHYALTSVGKNARPSPVREAKISMATRDQLGTLRKCTRQAVSLHAAVLFGTPAQVCVHCYPGMDGIPEGITPGVLRPLDADPVGRVILAHLDVAEKQSPTIREIRARGFAAGPGPNRDWLMLAAPILDEAIPIGAICVMGRRTSIESELQTCVSALMNARENACPCAENPPLARQR